VLGNKNIVVHVSLQCINKYVT